MSLTLQCDEPGCREQVLSNGSSAQVREIAAAIGWLVGEISYCPAHAPRRSPLSSPEGESAG